MEEMRNHEEEEKDNTVAFKTMERRSNICKEEGHLERTCKKERRKTNSKEKRCYNCNKTEHFAKDCLKSGGSKKNLHCTICKKNNHMERLLFSRLRNEATEE